ncbi:MAG: hypothetical protein WAL40_04795, partial [Rhodoplanes sp.]
LLLRPLSGVLSLTLVLIVFFVIEGVASMMFALESGIIDLILAAIILQACPAPRPGLSGWWSESIWYSAAWR